MTSVGAFVDLGIPNIALGNGPLWFDLDGSVGWGPQWTASKGLYHAARGHAETSAAWESKASWGLPLAVAVGTDLRAVVPAPAWIPITDWTAFAAAMTAVPIPGTSGLGLEVRAEAEIFPQSALDEAYDDRISHTPLTDRCRGLRSALGIELLATNTESRDAIGASDADRLENLLDSVLKPLDILHSEDGPTGTYESPSPPCML